MTGSPKQALRAAVLAARAALPDVVRRRRSDAIAVRVLALEAFGASRVVALYAAMGAEVATDTIAAAAAANGKRLLYPRVDESSRPLAFAGCSPDALVPGPHRTRQPPPAAPPGELEAVDLVLVPGVAFDERCRRLGRGRGHYDATLAGLPARALRVGLAFEVQLVPEVPQEPHDEPLDLVVTEDRVLRRSD